MRLFASRIPRLISVLSICVIASLPACAQDQPAKIGKLPGVTFDIKNKQVRVDAESLDVDAPLEFFCVLTNTSEHEAIMRSAVKPSDLHTALLAIGLKPGKPVEYSEAAKKWSPPQGPPLQIHAEWEKDGKTVSVPAYRLMRDSKTKKPMRAMTWVFVGSKQMKDGTYAADATGYIISVVNFDLTVIDIPDLASNANETLEWERNPDTAPPGGTKVTLVIEPAGAVVHAPAAVPAVQAPAPAAEAARAAESPATGAAATGDQRISDVNIDEARAKKLHDFWMQRVRPHENALREAAQAHYDVITALRSEQQRLIDEADRIQLAIDELEKEYQKLTTPSPSKEPEKAEAEKTEPEIK